MSDGIGPHIFPLNKYWGKKTQENKSPIIIPLKDNTILVLYIFFWPFLFASRNRHMLKKLR